MAYDYWDTLYGGDYIWGKTNKGVVVAAPVKKERTPEEQAVIDMLIKQRVSVYNSYEECMADANRKEEAYFISKTGWMVMRTRTINNNKLYFIDNAKECPLGTNIPRKVMATINEKIPKELLIEIIGSFNRINDKYHQEAAAQIYRKDDGTYFIYYPEQEISGAQVSYKNDKTMVDMRQKYSLAMELHSHNTMGAFWSSTDDNNETECGFYIVIGRFGNPTCEYKCRAKCETLYADMKAYEIFDMTPEEEVEMFKKENITEGNEEIEKKIVRSQKLGYGGTTYINGTTYYGDSSYYGGYNYGTYRKGKQPLPKKFVKELREANLTVIPKDHKLSSMLWKFADYDRSNMVYHAAGYKWSYDNKLGSVWTRYESLDDVLAKEPKDDADVSKFRDKIKNVGNYNSQIAKSYNRTALTNSSAASNYYANPRDVIDYLIGVANDTQARRMLVPGSTMQYTNYGVPDYVEECADEFEQAVHSQIVSRMKAEENIEQVLNAEITGSVPEVTPQSDNEFIDEVLRSIEAETFSVNFDLGVMWELFTPMEKSRLASAFGTSVLDLATQVTEFVNSGIVMNWELVYMIYKCILVPDNYELNLLDIIYKDASAADVNVFYTLNDALPQMVRDYMEALKASVATKEEQK